MSEEKPAKPAIQPSYADALIPLVSLVVLIAGSIYLFGLDAMDGYLQVGLILCSMITGLVILKNGHSWEEIAKAGQRGLSSIVSAIFILLAVGALIGTWNLSGTIPTLVYYGIQFLDPNWYYPATRADLRDGLDEHRELRGRRPARSASASSASRRWSASRPRSRPAPSSPASYVGDKTSPLSETTVLASQLVGADLYTHIRAQVWTSVPAFVIALVVFAVLGMPARASGPTRSRPRPSSTASTSCSGSRRST